MTTTNMEMSVYLQAIQRVAGSTPGEKYNTLNHIAKKIIKNSNGQRDCIQVQSSSELPEELIPLVKVEIARIIREPNGILEALKSDDNMIFHRALRAKWFFDGSIENITNPQYFQDNIFNYISMKNRDKLIHLLSIHLMSEKHTIAEEFYVHLSNMYGVIVSEPLLLACSESFVWNAIMTHKLVLSVRIVKKLYFKYPDVIVKYLRLSMRSYELYERNMHNISIIDYITFLPRLLKKHLNVFVELIDKHDYLPINLSRSSTDLFLKNGIDALMKHSKKLVKIMNLKSITSKLSEEQFKLFFRNLFPNKIKENYFTFSFMDMYKYLTYYSSDNKVSLLLITFEEVYKKSFLDFDELIEPEVLRLLPPKERVIAARKKLEKDQEWHTCYLEESWRCYLPINESIVVIKDKLKQTLIAEHRCEFLKQMIYSCRINDDKNALLDVLNYIATRHKNERTRTLFLVIERLLQDFQAQNLSIQHWKILDDIIQLLYTKDELLSHAYITEKIFLAKIHFCFVNNLSITEPIELIFKLGIDFNTYFWSYFQDHPEYERKCLEKFIEVAPSLYPADKSKATLIDTFLGGITAFNEHNSKVKSGIETISIKNYPWLSSEIQHLANIDNDDGVEMRRHLRECDSHLYDIWIEEKYKNAEIDLGSREKLEKWIKIPGKIIHLEKYYEEFKKIIFHNYVRRFIKECRWRQNLPIKFAEKCLQDLAENQSRCALIFLATLYEGSALERIIIPFLPTNSTIDVEAENSKKNYSITSTIPNILSIVNPPVSLNVTLQFCKGDYIQLVGNWLNVSSRRTSVDKLIPFAASLIDQPVSISKHFIRMYSKVANIHELCCVLINLWRKEKNTTIRSLVFEKIFNLFIINPNNQTWLLMTECIDGLTASDEEYLTRICNLEKIPNEYVTEYVDKLFITSKKFPENSKMINSRTAELLRLPNNIAVLFPEEFHRKILRTYFADMSLSSEILEAAQYYLINAYIEPAREELESRLIFYKKTFIDILKNQWNIPDPRKPHIYPANYVVDSMIIKILKYIHDVEVRKRFIDVTLEGFLQILKPLQAPVFYTFFIFASHGCEHEITSKEFAHKIGKIIPLLIDTFSIGFITNLGQILNEYLQLMWDNDDSSHEIIFDIIEGLLEVDNEHATMLAAVILMLDDIEHDNVRYISILQALQQHNNPFTIAHVSMKINGRSFEGT